ncbi:error-prone repair protein UmuD [Candidatus Roizmanbacteria bacterium]|nr:error-prone repair protein UmuD [Candidatus Roizmanbacteria bacterium]
MLVNKRLLYLCLPTDFHKSKNFIENIDGSPHILRCYVFSNSLSRFFSLPLFGTIKAGFPILADEHKDYLTLDEYLIEDPESSFLLRVSGDSLSGVGIFDGDMVIIERKKEAISGDIVLAQIDREWTLKILKRDRIKRAIYLEAANPKYPPFYPHQELQIFGVVKAVIRKFSN